MPNSPHLIIGVIDDDPGVVTVIGSLLGEEGYRIYSAGTVKDTVSLVAAHAPAALLMDIRLPDGDTAAVVAGLHLQGLPVPPIVLISGSNPHEIAEAQSVSGAVAALTKPFDVEAVMAVLEELLAHPRRATTLERTLTSLVDRGRNPHVVRCPVCRWLLYLGADDYVSGIFAARHRDQDVICPACGTLTPLPAMPTN